jgi:plasmid stabilization system protein ParE
MTLKWSINALEDLERIAEWVRENKNAKRDKVSVIRARAKVIDNNVRSGMLLGSLVDGLLPREVRKEYINLYEIRYEVIGSNTVIVNIFSEFEAR